MSNSIAETGHPNPIADYYRELMQQRGMSGNQLAKASGVSEASIRKLLDPDVITTETGFHPLVLKATSEVLGADTIYVFQLAGYLDPKEVSSDLGDEEFHFAVLFRELPSDKRQLLWDMLRTLQRSSGIPTENEQLSTLIRSVSELRRQYPMFIKRPFGIKDEIGRVVGNVTRTTTPDLMLNQFILKQLRYLFGDTAPDKQMVEQVLAHPDVVIILNMLLPRKEIPTALEKFFWLINPAGTLEKPFEKVDPSILAGIKALWLLMDQTAHSKAAKS